MMTSPRSANFSCRRANAGNDALQGAHHDAQKSTIITLPEAAGRPAPPGPASESEGKMPPGATWAGEAPASKASEAAARSRHDRFVLVTIGILFRPLRCRLWGRRLPG